MTLPYAIYTAETECQDCCKCIRQCPVKAIKVEQGHARIVPELCVACGHCVEVCPVRAKKVRDDLTGARELLATERPVYVSLAPSWLSEFPDLKAEQLIAALHRLGFAGVGETALGAEEVTAGVREALSADKAQVALSSACPAATAFVQKYLPDLSNRMTQMLSPLLAHCRLLREHFGPKIAIIFVGPCIAKKREADAHPELLDVALTFDDLRRWFEQAGIDPATLDGSGADFVPERAAAGNRYPIEGGMCDTLRDGLDAQVELETLSGLSQIDLSLETLASAEPDRTLFVELLACTGGCVNGPCSGRNKAVLPARLDVLRRLPDVQPTRAQSRIDLHDRLAAKPVAEVALSEDDLLRALRDVGKTQPEDELNCGGCGYETCRDFARALCMEKAEPAMCLSFLRRQATKKANALLRCMPSGVVIVDEQLEIIECNENFARLLGEEAEAIYEARPGMAGAALERLLPFGDLFRRVLDSGEELHRDVIRHGERLINITLFTIEPHHTIGGVFFDVTLSEQKREQIARQAGTVIKKNLNTVQEIACKLGEHMAETEVLLRRIADEWE